MEERKVKNKFNCRWEVVYLTRLHKPESIKRIGCSGSPGEGSRPRTEKLVRFQHLQLIIKIKYGKNYKLRFLPCLKPFSCRAHLNNFVGLISLSLRNCFSFSVTEIEIQLGMFLKLYKLYNKFINSLYYIICISCIKVIF